MCAGLWFEEKTMFRWTCTYQEVDRKSYWKSVRKLYFQIHVHVFLKLAHAYLWWYAWGARGCACAFSYRACAYECARICICNAYVCKCVRGICLWLNTSVSAGVNGPVWLRYCLKATVTVPLAHNCVSLTHTTNYQIQGAKEIKAFSWEIRQRGIGYCTISSGCTCTRTSIYTHAHERTQANALTSVFARVTGPDWLEYCLKEKATVSFSHCIASTFLCTDKFGTIIWPGSMNIVSKFR